MCSLRRLRSVEEKVNLQCHGGNAKPWQQRHVRRLLLKSGAKRLMHKLEIILDWSNQDRAFVAELPELPGRADGVEYMSSVLSC